MRKIIVSFLLAALCILTCMPVTADETDNGSSDSFTLFSAVEPLTLDAAMCCDNDIMYAYLQYEGLFRLDIDTAGYMNPEQYEVSVVSGQAKAVKISEDETVYRFTLRDDIYWSDGEQVKASDFVYAWQRLVDPENDAYYGDILNGIVLNASEIRAGNKEPSELGVAAEDDSTFTVTLEQPFDGFTELCASIVLAPMREDIVENGGCSIENNVVNGPYKAVEWTEGKGISFEANRLYYNVQRNTIKTVYYSFENSIPDFDNLSQMVKEEISGDISLEKSDNFNYIPYPGAVAYVETAAGRIDFWFIASENNNVIK